MARYIDNYGFILDSSNTVDEGKGDSIGTLALMYMATGKPEYAYPLLHTATLTVAEETMRLYRHPTCQDHYDTSRDHTIYWVMAMSKAYREIDDPVLKICARLFIRLRKWAVSDKFNRTIDMWIWENIVLRDAIKDSKELFSEPARIILSSKIWNFIYYLIMIPQMFFTMLWNYAVRVIFRLDREELYMLSQLDESFCGKKTYNKWAKLLFPAYARHIAAWQLHVLPDSVGKKILQWIYIKMDVGNAVIRGLCGKTLLAKILDIIYNPVTGYRWSTELNNTSDRYMVHYRDNDIMPDKTVLRYVAMLP